jgi:hypothetical protein
MVASTSRSFVGLAACISLAWTLTGCGHREASYVAPAFGPELEMAADTQAHAAMPDGERLPQVFLGLAYARGSTSDWTIPLLAGQCYAFGYGADGDVGRVAMYIWDPANRRVEHARGRPEQGVFTYCAASNGIHRLEAKAAGPGHFVVVGYTGASARWISYAR